MRTVTLAFAALMPFLSLANAAPIPPEILAQCEKEFGDDLKKQLGCVTELVDALTKFRDEKKAGDAKKTDEVTSGRKIGVTEKPGSEEEEIVEEETPGSEGEEETAVVEEPVKKLPTKKAAKQIEEGEEESEVSGEEEAVEEPVKKPKVKKAAKKSEELEELEPGEAVVELNFKSVAAYCEAQYDEHGKQVDSIACEEEEDGANKNLEYASSKYEGDIPGDPMVACKKFVDAYQPLANGYYSPKYPVLRCLKSKIATRIFADCFTRYSGLAYSPQLQSVPEESAGDVATCFRKLIIIEG